MDEAQRKEAYFRHQLIAFVRLNEHLWNREHNLFCNRAFKLRTWKEIADKLGKTARTVNQAWETLRNQYRREYNREINYGIKTKWQYYQEMSFIRSAMRTKPPVNFSSDSELEHEHIRARQDSTRDDQEMERFIIDSSSEFQAIKLSLEWKETEATQTQQQLSSKSYQPSELRAEQPAQSFDSIELGEESATDSQNVEIKEIMETDGGNTDEQLNSRIKVGQAYTATLEPCAYSHSKLIKRQQFQQRDELVPEKRICPVEGITQSAYTELQDEDYHFVISILPALRRVQGNRKLLLRMDIMALLPRELGEN